MVWTKRWASSSSGDYTVVANWAPIGLVNSVYKWTASGSGTNEYYCELSGGGNPGFTAAPGSVQEDGSNMVSGTLGALAAGEYGYGDNDTLGYSTIYVRLTDESDPDSNTVDFVTYKQIPQATDHVRIPAGTASISSNMEQAGVAIGDFIVEAGFTNAIGTATAWFRCDPNYFRFEGSGSTASYIDIYTAAISPEIYNTASASAGTRGLYLIGSAVATLVVNYGKVGFAWRAGETGTITTAQVTYKDSKSSDATSLWLGSGTSLTTWEQTGGNNIIACAATTVKTYGGILTTMEDGAITTMTASGGTIYPNSTGTISTLNAEKGVVVDFTKSAASRTVTNLKENYSTVSFDHNVLTITNRTNPDDGPIKRVVTPL